MRIEIIQEGTVFLLRTKVNEYLQTHDCECISMSVTCDTEAFTESQKYSAFLLIKEKQE